MVACQGSRGQVFRFGSRDVRVPMEYGIVVCVKVPELASFVLVIVSPVWATLGEVGCWSVSGVECTSRRVSGCRVEWVQCCCRWWSAVVVS